MTNILGFIISLVALLLIIFIKDIISRKSKNTYHGTLYYKLTNFNRALIILSILIFIIVAIIDYNINSYNRSWLSFITIAINALSVAILTLPISLSNIYNTIFNDEEKIADTKYVVTTIYDKKIIYKLNRAGIKVILLTTEKLDSKIKRIEPKAFKKTQINSNLIINSDDPKVVKSIPDAIYEYKNLNKGYHAIEEARAKADAIARIIKYTMLSYIPLVLLFFILIITGYPAFYNIVISILTKLLTVLTVEYVYKKMPKDNDLMNRSPIENGKIIGKQEILFIIFTCICTLFCYSFPYQYIIFNGGSINFALSILLTSFLFNNLLITYVLYSESAMIKNIIKSFKNIRMIIYLLIIIFITIIINFVTILGTDNIGVQNYFVCIVFGLIPLLILEIIKLARFTTMKGKKKNVPKNNKRHKKS